MAVTLPDYTVYGSRPSMQSGRLDKPDTSGVDMAESLSAAAANLQAVMEEKKGKEDSLNYSLARNEIQVANIEEQAALAEDQDWGTHVQRYEEKFKTRAQEIARRYNLNPNDAQILDAESRLIGTRGRVSIAGNARKLEIGEGVANLDAGMAKSREVLINANTGERNAIMLGQLDSITAAQEKGYLTAVEAESRRQTLTQDYALATIEALPPGERRMMLEAAQGYRRGYGFNKEYSALINEASKMYPDVPPQLLAAQIQMESSGNPEAKSGARGDPTGLMQLGKAAAQDMGVTDRTDPKQSIVGGAGYNSKMLKLFDGDKAKALAAYNWGRSNVLEAFDKYGDDWLANAPTETKNYVEKLLPYWEGTAAPSGHLTATDTGMGPLTAEDIRAGKGSGYVADFLHSDTLAKLLDQAAKEDKENTDTEDAFRVKDEAFNLFPDDSEKRREYIKNNADGKVRDKAEIEEEQETNRQYLMAEREAQALYDNYSRTMQELADEGDPNNFFRVSEISAADKDKMGAARVDQLEQRERNIALGKQHADVTQYVEPEGGGASVDKWNNLPDYGDGETKVSVDLNDPEWRNALDREMWYTLKGDQANLLAQENKFVEAPNVKPYVQETLTVNGYNGVTDKDEQKAIEARLIQRVRSEALTLQNSYTPPRKLNSLEINGIIANVMQEQAFVKSMWFDSERNVATMTRDELDVAYLPIEDAKTKPYIGPDPRGQDLNYYQYLRQLSKSLTKNGEAASDDDIQRAYFAHVSGLGTDEVNRRLKGE
jgi:soluble lytic murein transglycosylase-like protein